jgi:methyl-accepting chemotaxis protein
MWIRLLSVRARLLVGFSVLLGLMLVVGNLAAQRLGQLRGTIHVVSQEVPERVNAANELIDAVNEGARFKLALFATHSPDLIKTSSAGVASARARINASYEKLDKLFDPKAANDPESFAQLQKVKELRKTHAAAFDNAAKIKKAGQEAEADQLLGGEVLPSLTTYIEGIKALIAIQDKHMAAEATLAAADASSSQSMIRWLCGLAALLGLGVARAIYHSIADPLGKLTVAARSLSKGDCDVEVGDAAAKDEVGELALAMSEMAKAERELAHGAQRLATGDMSQDVRVRGDKDVLGSSMAHLQATLGQLGGAIATLTEAGKAGRLKERAPAERFEGAFRELVSGLNATLDAVLEPIGEARRALGAVAARQLSARMPLTFAGDHATLAQTFNTATDALDQTLREVHGAAEQVNSASGQIAESAQLLAQGAAEQAASLDRVTVTIQELSSVTRDNATRAEDARRLSAEALESTARGSAVMQELSQAMVRIRESSAATARILKTIDEIASQTNLLALNAAVESARAGDAGRGFGVVAEEVRDLARRSAEAAKETGRLIAAAVQSAEQGVTLERSVAQELGGVSAQVQQVGQVLSRVADACSRQRDDIDKLSSAFGALNGTTQQAAATAEESASAAEELASQATLLTGMVGRFELSREEERAHALDSVVTPSRRAPELRLVHQLRAV